MYFIYGEAELAYLRRKDKRLAAVIDRIGPVERTADPDLFSAVVHHIIGQQISMKAQATIWQRMQDTLGSVSAETILAAGVPALQALGMTFRKAEYLTDLAGRIMDGSFDLEAVRSMDDAEAIRALSSLRGIGVWTAEMILLFCLQRPDIFSYDDLAIRRGLRMVYRHRRIDRALFEKYRDGCTKAYRELVTLPAYTLDTSRQAKLVRPLYMRLLDEKQETFAKHRLVQAMENYRWRLGTGFLSTPFILDVLADMNENHVSGGGIPRCQGVRRQKGL